MLSKNNKEKQKVVVGMSGGVDSSAAAFLLLKQGFDVVGVSLKFAVWNHEKNLLKENVCCSSGSFLVAKNICNQLGVPFKIIDVKERFLEKVINYWKKEIKNYNTPNPCIVCNHEVKIQALIEFAKTIGAQYVATGHYAKVDFDKKTKMYHLKSAKDKTKDQIYFLSQLNQSQLKMLKFPLSEYTKEEVYKIVKKAGFKVFQKTKQSQDFCFVANKSYEALVETELGFEKGDIVDANFKKIGQHKGLAFYTIGQRKGINLSGGPFYVKSKNILKNELVVTKNKKDLFEKEFEIKNVKLMGVKEEDIDKKEVLVQIRYGDKKAKAKIFVLKKGVLKVVLQKPKMAITPGQFAVLYLKNKCIGSGPIKN